MRWSGLGRKLPDFVAGAHCAGNHDSAVGASQAKLSTDFRVHEFQGVDSKTCRELRASRVRGFAELDYG